MSTAADGSGWVSDALLPDSLLIVFKD